MPSTNGDKAWAASRLGWDHVPTCNGITAVEDNVIKAVSLYENFLANASIMHCVVEDPRVLWTAKRPIFEYPFIQLDRELLLTFTPEDNVRSLRIQNALGFKLNARIPGHLILQMTRSDCRWLRRKAA
jgi:hypothetical protein